MFIEAPGSTGKSEEIQSTDKTKEVKVRRTKAGFEPYQVKKKLSISLLESKTQSPNRSSSKGSADNKSRKSSEEKDRRHSSASRSHHNRDRKSSQSKSSQISSSKQSDKTDKTKKKPSLSTTKSNKEEVEQKSNRAKSLVKQEKPKLTKEEEERIKKKNLGLSILECPCSLSSSENCDDCSPTAAKEKSQNGSNHLAVDTENNDQTGSVIDTKFLIASPRALQKEKSVLESDNEEETSLMESMDNIPHKITNTNHVSMTHDEINTMFTATDGKKDRLSSVSGNSDLFVSEEDFDSNKSNSVITISSCSDTESNSKVNNAGEGVQRKQSRDSESKGHHYQPRQRNVLSNIQSILNENKSLDKKSKSSPARNHSNVASLPVDRKRERNPQKDSKRDSRKRKDNNNKKKQGKRDSSKLKNNYGSFDDIPQKHSGGILTLPQDCQEQLQTEQRELKESSPQTRQVHFDISGKL